MTGAVAIFVKTPGRSPIKTRLAAGIGERAAIDWYRQAAAAVASVARLAQARHGLTAYWAVAEPASLDAWTDLPAIAQGPGGLGARMAQVHAQLVARHGFGMLLGADSPQLTPELLGEAGEWLADSSPRFALGPARDGGFWLFGGNRAPPLPLWTAVRYSAANTARDLQHGMRDAGDWRTLATLTDVDHVRDLGPVGKALQDLAEPTIEQRALADWMRDRNAPKSP